MLKIFRISFTGLKNFLICKFHRLFCGLKYPWKILPRPTFANPINIENLVSETPAYIVRRSPLPLTETFNDVGILKDEALRSEEVAGLSMNLLGSHFKLDYIKFRTLGS